MDEEPPSQPPPGKPSQVPSWIMLGFVLGALFVLALPRRPSIGPEIRPSAEATPQAPARPADRPQITTIEAVFAAWEKYAVWSDDTTEVALWSASTRSFSECYEVLRNGDARYFRSISRLPRPILERDAPLLAQLHQPGRREALRVRRDAEPMARRERDALEQKQCVQAKVHLDVSGLLKEAIVEFRAMHQKFHLRRLHRPLLSIRARDPKIPKNFEQVSMIFVQQVGGKENGCLRTYSRTKALFQNRGLAPGNRMHRKVNDSWLLSRERKMAHHPQGVRQHV